MEKLKKKIETLLSKTDKNEQVKELQEINQLILTKYLVQIDKKLRIYPIEVEAYYYNGSEEPAFTDRFPDPTVHRNELQKKRFGQLYFHRAGRSKDSSFLYDQGGIDICLSFSEDYYLGVLIRSARVNNEETPICGPGTLTKIIVQHICKEDNIIEITENERLCILKLEDKISLATYDHLLAGKRYGIGRNKIGVDGTNYGELNLRSLIELNLHPFKGKEQFAIDYFKEKIVVATEDAVRNQLGYVLNECLDSKN